MPILQFLRLVLASLQYFRFTATLSVTTWMAASGASMAQVMAETKHDTNHILLIGI